MKDGITSPMGHGTLESLVLAPARIVRRMAGWRGWREESGCREGRGSEEAASSRLLS